MKTTAMRNYDSSDVIIENHRKRIEALRGRLKEAIEKKGHQCDDDLRLVDGKPTMVFILPSNDTVYVGFGPTGGRKAYNGPEEQFDADSAAQAVSDYLHETAAPSRPLS